jgi:hypothetical protein
MKVTYSSVVFTGLVQDRSNIVSFCSLSQLSDGTLIVTARIGSAKDSADGNVGIWRSADGGLSWVGPLIPFSTAVEGKKGCLRAGFVTELSEKKLLMTMAWVDRSVPDRLLYNAKTGGLCEMFPVFAESFDKGLTWSAPRKVDISPVTLPAALTGPTLVLDDGSLACQFEVQKSWDDTSPIFNISTLKISHDNGKSWTEHVEVAGRSIEEKVCWDQRIARLGSGKLINLFWAYNTAENKDLNIHVGFSADDGRTWSKPRDTGIKGQIACPVTISEKHILMLYVRRDEKRRIMAMSSYDGGQSWDDSSELCIYEHPDCTESDNLFEAMNQWSYGHPYGTKTGHDEIAAVYYAGNPETMSLHFCKITF